MNEIIAVRYNEYVLREDDCLIVKTYGGDARELWRDERLTTAKLITLSHDLAHVAFWHRASENFYLERLGSGQVWRKRINTDKADGIAIRFSLSDDLVACFDEYDGAYRVHLYSLAKGYERKLVSLLEPIIHDDDLRRFVCVEKQNPPLIFTPPLYPDVVRIRDRNGSVREELVLK